MLFAYFFQLGLTNFGLLVRHRETTMHTKLTTAKNAKFS